MRVSLVVGNSCLMDVVPGQEDTGSRGGHTPGRVYSSYPGLWGIDSELLSPVAGGGSHSIEGQG